MSRVPVNFIDGGLSSTLYVELPGSIRYGLFYSSGDGKRHIAFYVPYRQPPSKSLCGKTEPYFCSTRTEDGVCQDCLKVLRDNALT